MNLLEKVSFKGEWFLPQTPDDRHVGELFYDPDKGIELELHGNFSGSYSDEKTYEIINGLVEGSRYITLFHVFQTDGGTIRISSTTETSLPTSKYSVNRFFVNCRVDKKEELLFTSANVHFDQLEEWVGISGFIYQDDFWNNETKEAHLRYRLPIDIKFKLPYEGVTASFKFRLEGLRKSIFNKEINLEQITTFSVSSETPKEYNELQNIILRMQYFIVLGRYKRTCIDSFTLSMPCSEEVVDYYYKQTYRKPYKLRITDTLFHYIDIQKKFEDIIYKWYSLCNDNADIVWLLMDQLLDDTPFSAINFLSVAQVAESIHSYLYNHPREDKKIFKKKIEEIIASVPDCHKDFVKSKLLQSNSLVFKERLYELLDKCPSSLVDYYISNKDLFIEEIKDSRNYYTHYSGGGKTHIVKGHELLRLSYCLRLLIIYVIFINIGFSEEEIVKIDKGHSNRFSFYRRTT